MFKMIIEIVDIQSICGIDDFVSVRTQEIRSRSGIGPKKCGTEDGKPIFRICTWLCKNMQCWNFNVV